MRIEVLLFASLRDRVGSSSVTVEVPDRLSIADLKSELSRQVPNLGGLDGIRVAVDREFRYDTEPVAAGVEVALIPPVSGG